MKSFKKLCKLIIVALSVLSLFVCTVSESSEGNNSSSSSTIAAAATSLKKYDSKEDGITIDYTSIKKSATAEETVDNGDGTFTFNQTVDGTSTTPHYTGPWTNTTGQYGFGFYSYFNQDYGWMHNFPDWSVTGLNIVSAKLTVYAYDVDAETSHGTDGEYDGLSVDGVKLDPGLLQGTNGTWSITTFDIPLTSITDDGNINVYLDIDMNHTTMTWATTISYSKLEIKYAIGALNIAPYQPTLSITPSAKVDDNDNLVVTVTGPNPADPDNDAVTYTYRWFVDVGQGSFVDDDFAGRGEHTGNTVPSSDTVVGDIWRVQVTPTDEHNAVGSFATITWQAIEIVNLPPVANAGVDQTVEQSFLGGSNVQLDASLSSDPLNNVPLTYAWAWSGGSATGVNPTIQLQLGTTNITLTVTNSKGLTSTDEVSITVVDTKAPVLTVPADITIEQLNLSGTPVTLSASATDICDSSVEITSNAPAVFPLGETVVTFNAKDDSGNSISASTKVTVVDTQSPAIALDVYKETIWPPDHKMVKVAKASATDICDASPILTINVVSNEKKIVHPNCHNEHHKNKPDWQIDADGTIWVRAENNGFFDRDGHYFFRDSHGHDNKCHEHKFVGRIYTITVIAKDASGNVSSEKTVQVYVKPDKNEHDHWNKHCDKHRRNFDDDHNKCNNH